MRFIATLLFGMMLAASGAARAQAAEDAPIPMLNTGGHMALIRDIAFTPDGGRSFGGGRQGHPGVGCGHGENGAHPPRRGGGGLRGHDLRHGAVAGWQMAGGGGMDGDPWSEGHHIRLYDFASGKLVVLPGGMATPFLTSPFRLMGGV